MSASPKSLLGAVLLSTVVVSPILFSAAEDGGHGDWPAWAIDEEELRRRVALVNEGELAFLSEPPTDAIHRHNNRIVISERSLVDGWVTLEQCHRNIDRVPEVQILFRPERSRALEVVSFRNMDAAYAERNTVQLRGIRASSEVCLRAETKALNIVASDVFELRNGPFMRRFLDGYYPLQVSMQIDFPHSLVLADFDPQVQPGFSVQTSPGQVRVEALFEGQLQTRFRFLAN